MQAPGAAPAREGTLPGLPPLGPGPAPAPAPESWRPPLPPPRSAGTGPPRAAGAAGAAAASSPVLLLLGEEDEDEEGGSRRRRGLGRVEEKPRGGAEEEDDDEEDEDEEVVVEVVDGDDDEEDSEERFMPLGPGRAVPKGPARGALKVRAGHGGARGTRQPRERDGPGPPGEARGLRPGTGDRWRPGREGCVRRRRRQSEGTDELTPRAPSTFPRRSLPSSSKAGSGWLSGVGAGKGHFSLAR